ncbi:hypothetical protein UCDDS831_g05715 [Diplodia seriata]|uniref:BTB domain-containing protein n=1 Tax=Diplodia seriata TaxID=420778 RepID=A0A0G2G5N0_9PEZI|nr:hypothetical protein UCDDS831_g05715 [Diplodia seriata]
MASSPSPAVRVTNYPHTSVKIAPEPDLTVRVYEYEDVYAPHGQLPPIKCVTDFAVSRAVLRANSEPFNKMLGGGWKESTANPVELKGNDWIMNLAMEVFFRAFHGVPMSDECLNADVAVVWSILRAGDMWHLKREGLNKWFKGWFQKWAYKNVKGKDLSGNTSFRDYKLAQVILYPCWVFDHAPGFAAATKWLVYNSISHITESNPTKHRNLHLPPRVIQQLNAARGRLKGLMHDHLWKPIEAPLEEAECDCKEKTLFLYQKALLAINVWPLERTFSKTSVADLLARLMTFEYKTEHEPCYECSIPCEYVVSHTVESVSKHFDGLCLFCMAKSAKESPDGEDWYYWHHDCIKDWDKDCRRGGVRHGEPTWYYSYMGAARYRDVRETWYRDRRDTPPS